MKGAPGLYGAPADQEIVQPPRIPSPTHDVENKSVLYEGRRKKKKKRSRSRSREPQKPTQTVDAWAGARPAYYDQLTSIEHVRDSLPISFLIETGQHKEVLRRRLSYALLFTEEKGSTTTGSSGTAGGPAASLRSKGSWPK